MPPDPVDPVDPVDWRMSSKPMIPLRTSIKKSALGPPGNQVFKDLPERSHEGPQGDPEGPQERPRAPQGIPKRSSMASQRDPKESPGTEKEVQRKPIYIKTPDQPHSGRYVTLSGPSIQFKYIAWFEGGRFRAVVDDRDSRDPRHPVHPGMNS